VTNGGEGGGVSSRDVRTGTARRSGPPRQPAPDPVRRGEGLVVGDVPVLARVSGVLLVLAGLAGIASTVPDYLVVGGERLSLSGNLAATVVTLLLPLTALVVGGVLALGRVPKFGLAYAAMAGAIAVGRLLIEIYLGRSSTARPGVEVLAGRLVLTSSVDIRAGWILAVVSLALVVLAGLVALMAWGRTPMDDAGRLDPARSTLAGAAVLLGVLTVLCLTLPAADVPDDLVTDPTTGLQTVVEREGPQALLKRPLLALFGGLLLAAAVLLCSVVAPSLRPRPAAVGGLLALATAVLGAGLGGWSDAVGSDDLEWTVPGAGLVLAGLGYVLLTVLAWRLRRERAAQE
jgi:hypothetical protein